MMNTERTPSQVTLKNRQADAYETIMSKYQQGVRSQLINLPTGLGKTVLAVHAAGAFKNTLFTAPTMELVEQIEATIHRLYPGETINRLHGKNRDISARFTVTTIATLTRRIHEIPADQFALLVVDESHHSKATTWEKAIRHFTPDLLLGLSATPERLDGRALSDLFTEMTYSMNTKEAVQENYLAEPVGIQVHTTTSLDNVTTQAGDFNQHDLSETVNTYERNHQIIDAHQKHASGRKTVAFTVTIEHAKSLAEDFNNRGIKATWVSGADPERHQKISDYQAGKYEVITNVNLLTEGFDDPATNCIIMARPTTSRVLYTQALGRGLRTHTNKENCIIIDVADNTRKHRLVNIWAFWGITQPKMRHDKLINLLEFETEHLTRRINEVLNINANEKLVTELVNLLEPAPRFEPPAGTHLTSSMRNAAHSNALRMLIQYGYNVFENDWTVWQANQAINAAITSGRQRNPQLLNHLTA